MNLIEELADVIADSGTHYGKAMNLLPIFAEWIKGVEKPLAATLDDFPYTIMPLTIKDAFAIGVKSFESNILSALDKKE
jgi:hypothetical protein